MLNQGITEIAAALAKGEYSSVELTQAYLAEIGKHNPDLNAYITVTGELALTQAKAADATRAKGAAGVFTGVPFAHKDIFCTTGVKTTCGSRMLDKFISPYDATVSARLNAAGGVMLGKTNM